MRKCYLFGVFSVLLSGINGVEDISFDSTSRIVNGTIASNLQFPYAVSIQSTSSLQFATRGHVCGGALVSLRHVLTAASCFYSYVNNVYTLSNPSNFRVFAGSNLLTDDTNANRVRGVSSITPHPQYSPTTFINNIAVATLASAFPGNTGLAVLSVGVYIPADDSICTVAGWGGNVSNSLASLQLRYTSKYIYNQQQCIQLYASQSIYPNIIPSMLCAGQNQANTPSCTGDIGNALVCNGNLTAILSVHHNCTTITWPEIYTRTSDYATWIRGIVGNSAAHVVPGFILFASVVLLQIL